MLVVATLCSWSLWPTVAHFVPQQPLEGSGGVLIDHQSQKSDQNMFFHVLSKKLQLWVRTVFYGFERPFSWSLAKFIQHCMNAGCISKCLLFLGRGGSPGIYIYTYPLSTHYILIHSFPHTLHRTWLSLATEPPQKHGICTLSLREKAPLLVAQRFRTWARQKGPKPTSWANLWRGMAYVSTWIQYVIHQGVWKKLPNIPNVMQKLQELGYALQG